MKRLQPGHSFIVAHHFSNCFCFCLIVQSTADQLRRDFNRIKQQYGASVQKAARLEQELNQANSKIKSLESKEITSNTSTLSNELCEVKSQLAQKSALLDQVKFLLQKAAVREKLLQEEVSSFSIRFIIKHCIIVYIILLEISVVSY